MKRFSSHSGVTLVELLIFVCLIAMASVAVLGFFFLTADARVHSQGQNEVRQVAVQLTQMLTHELRNAERITYPARTATGTLVVLQMPVSSESPLALALQSGALVLVRGADTSAISPAGITVSQLKIQNLSPTDTHPSLKISFILTKKLALPVVQTITLPIELSVAPLPTDTTQGNSCGCAAPTCVGGILHWNTCASGSCQQNSGSFSCP